MQKLKYLGYIIFTLVIIFLIFIIYNNVQGKENEETQMQEKLETEIRYLETNIVNMFNNIRGLEYKKYDLDEKEVDFEKIKKTISQINVSTPTITLDLYKIGVSSENVLSFTKNLDELNISINEESQMEGMKKLLNMYTLINNYAQKSKISVEYVKTLETKQKIFEAYLLLDYDKWEQIDNKTKEAIKIFSELFNEENIEIGKQDTINSIYVMLNELNSSTNLKDKKVFLGKYLKVLDEMQVL